MEPIRPPAVAGTFYPAKPPRLRAAVETLLEGAKRSAPPTPDFPPKVIVVPHAGLPFSGPIAASAYQLLTPGPAIQRVVILGPSHWLAFKGLALPDHRAFRTPLGDVELDLDAMTQLLEHHPDLVRVNAAAHAREHGLEVQLPFLQTLLPAFRLVPLVVGDAQPAQVAQVLELLWGDDATLIAISTDLSHYLSYDRAKALDGATCQAVEALDSGTIDGAMACGYRPLNGLLFKARRQALAIATLDLRNSGDTAGDRRRVVGYGAWALGQQTL